jgi:hypothetical protein
MKVRCLPGVNLGPRQPRIQDSQVTQHFLAHKVPSVLPESERKQTKHMNYISHLYLNVNSTVTINKAILPFAAPCKSSNTKRTLI